MGNSVSTNQKLVLEFKSCTFNVPALVLNNNKISDITQELQRKISQAPGFFKNSPLLIDLHELTKSQTDIDLTHLVKTLRGLQFIPIAVSGATAKQNTVAIELGLTIQPSYSLNQGNSRIAEKTPVLVPVTEESKSEIVEAEPVAAAPIVENKLITHPVRSGQRIYAKGDLTILAPVNAGAEVIAEGNIHVYAPLRGRALAGVQGNTKCSIFCADLQAELISIAGIYQLNEDLDKKFQHKLVQVYLQEQTLLIKEL